MGARHGLRKDPLYDAWRGIKERCTNAKSTSFVNYGGRGISMWPEWASSPAAFARDVGPRPSPGHTLDRIDNDRGYEPGNVRWATSAEQRRNSRHLHLITRNGVTKCAFDWATDFGIAYRTLLARLARGWSEDRALTTVPGSARTRPESRRLPWPLRGASRHLEKSGRAVGARNGAFTSPEARPRGERHGSQTQPERTPRGERHGRAKLTEANVLAIRAARADGVTIASLAQYFRVSRNLISLIARREIWRALP